MGRVARTKAVIYSPPTETELRLQELQEKFLDPNGCSKADKDEFFLVMRMYARSITLQMIKSKGLVLPPERVDEVCTDATLAIFKQYQKVGWRIEASFAGALRWKVVESLYYKDIMGNWINGYAVGNNYIFFCAVLNKTVRHFNLRLNIVY